MPGNEIDRSRPVSSSNPHPVIRLGIRAYQAPPLNEPFRFLAEPSPKVKFFFVVPTPQQVAQQVKSLARNGTVFLVTPLTVTNGKSRVKSYPYTVLEEFIRAMAPDFRIVKRVTYPGFESPESVYVLRGPAANAGRGVVTK